MYSNLLFITCALVSYPRNHCQTQCHNAFPLFSSKSFIVFTFMFRSLIHFELMFCLWCKVRIQLLLLVDIQFSQHRLLRRAFFFHWMLWAPLSEIIWPYMKGFVSGLSVPLVHMSVFMPEPHYFDYCSFVVSFETQSVLWSSSHFTVKLWAPIEGL